MLEVDNTNSIISTPEKPDNQTSYTMRQLNPNLALTLPAIAIQLN